METIAIEHIKLGENIRQEYGDIDELAESIRQNGVQQPVKLSAKKELLDGYRRVRAAKKAGLLEVPYVIDENPTDRRVLQLLHGIYTKNLTPTEEGAAFYEVMIGKKLTAEMLAQRLGKPTKYIERRLQLMKAIPEVQDALSNKKIEVGHADLLVQLTAAQQKEALTFIIDNDLTVQNFADQIRWNTSVDFGETEFRPEPPPRKQTLLTEVCKEMKPKIEYDDGPVSSKTFRPELLKYVEEQRAQLRAKGIKVFNSVAEATKEYPQMEWIRDYHKEYTTAAKKLPGSEIYAVVVDLSNRGYLTKDIFRCTPKEEPAPAKEEEPKKLSKAKQEEAEEMLEKDRKQKLLSRMVTWKHDWLVHELIKHADTHILCVLGIKHAICSNREEPLRRAALKEFQLNKRECFFLDSKDLNAMMFCLPNLKNLSPFEKALSLLGRGEIDGLDNETLEMFLEHLKWDPTKSFELTDEFLNFYTKDQLQQLAKEWKMALGEETSSKEELIGDILGQWKKGMVPKALLKAR